jgi:hypothetical protein
MSGRFDLPVHSARSALRAVAVALAVVGCGASRPASPQDALSAYAAALRAGKAQEAYALLSDDAKKDIPYESFRRIVRENPEEVLEIGRALGRPAAPPRVTATVKAPNGESLLLVLEDGAWRVDGAAIDLYAQATPDLALRSFVRAFKNRRYDVLLRFVPESEREGLGVEELKHAWEGEERTELEGLVTAVETSLPSANLEVTGDRATMAFGTGGTVELVREDGLWKVEDIR